MTMLAVAEAQARLIALAVPVPIETLPIGEAHGRWTAADITALRTQPSHDLSAMDGYAIRCSDLPGPFRLIGESAAGHPFAGTVNGGETVRIFTGAAMPEGADTVLVQEEALRAGDEISLSGEGPPSLGSSVRRRGLDFVHDACLIDRGERLTAARIALAAAAGHGSLVVNRPIRVALVATGDELVPPGTATHGAQLPESNGVMLAAILRELPVNVTDHGILPDRIDALTARFSTIDADILVTTGGASVGDHDLVRPALEAAGGQIDFWRIAVRPGKPMMAGMLGKTLILGLPGNPVAAFVTAHLFLRPLIAAFGGARHRIPSTLSAILGTPLPANNARQDYLRATIRDGRVWAAHVQDSSMLLVLAGADCLIVRPPHAPPAKSGDSVDILPLA